MLACQDIKIDITFNLIWKSIFMIQFNNEALYDIFENLNSIVKYVFFR